MSGKFIGWQFGLAATGVALTAVLWLYAGYSPLLPLLPIAYFGPLGLLVLAGVPVLFLVTTALFARSESRPFVLLLLVVAVVGAGLREFASYWEFAASYHGGATLKAALLVNSVAAVAALLSVVIALARPQLPLARLLAQWFFYLLVAVYPYLGELP